MGPLASKIDYYCVCVKTTDVSQRRPPVSNSKCCKNVKNVVVLKTTTSIEHSLYNFHYINCVKDADKWRQNVAKSDAKDADKWR